MTQISLLDLEPYDAPPKPRRKLFYLYVVIGDIKYMYWKTRGEMAYLIEMEKRGRKKPRRYHTVAGAKKQIARLGDTEEYAWFIAQDAQCAIVAAYLCSNCIMLVGLWEENNGTATKDT